MNRIKYSQRFHGISENTWQIKLYSIYFYTNPIQNKYNKIPRYLNMYDKQNINYTYFSICFANAFTTFSYFADLDPVSW